MATDESQHESDPATSFDKWFSGRPKWLQTAAHDVFSSRRMPSDDDIIALANLCRAEADGDDTAQFRALPAEAFADSREQAILRLAAIENLTGVNALRDGAAVNFDSSAISVVFGLNGSGKSGFSRVLKQACGCRGREPVHRNVFRPSPPTPSATIRFSRGDVPSEFKWSADGPPSPSLRDVHVFDSRTASMYVSAKNEATYEPRRMRFLSSMASICDRVHAVLESQKCALVSSLPKLPEAFRETKAAGWLSSVRASTSLPEIDERCTFTAELAEERKRLEAALDERDAPARIRTLQTSRARLANFAERWSALKGAFSDDKINSILAARADALDMRAAARDAAGSVFRDAPLAGVGEKTWLALWEQARLFSQSHAYPDARFPHTEDGSRCVLCQNELGTTGAERLSRFEAFVKGGLESEASKAEAALRRLMDGQIALPPLHQWLIETESAGVGIETARQTYAALASRAELAGSARIGAALPPLEWASMDLVLEEERARLEKEESTMTALQNAETRKQAVSQLRELNAIRWLNESKAAVQSEVQRLAAVAMYDRAMRLAKTNALTSMKNELAKTELEAGYRARFARELGELCGNRIRVMAESTQEGKARIRFAVALDGARSDPNVVAPEVLSEGEFRIVALAAFLADMTGWSGSTPFVFDDPISSLDQMYEERVVARLAALARERQIIVFTHRLSLLSLLEAECDQKQIALQEVGLHRVSDAAGHVHNLSIRHERPRSAVNRLRDHAIPRLRKLASAGDVDDYQRTFASCCTDFRILVECCVEKILLNEVVVRFRRAINTKNKIGALAKIDASDCELIEDLMTRYSVYEHSQPAEVPAALPEVDDFENDVRMLANWIQAVEQRSKPQAK